MSARGPDLAALEPLYERMLLLRRAEEKLGTLFARGEIPGFIHLAIGQEAVAVGVAAALAPGDTIASTHRGHGHALARGVDLAAFFREVLGRRGGLCGGRGGSMHVADAAVGMLGANGIVAAGLPIALGSALAHRVQGRPALAVAFFGDGAVAEGVLHETLNLAALWRLPLLLVCENNGWSEFSPSAGQLAARLPALADAFGIPYRAADGDDVESVSAAAAEAAGAARSGGGPRFLECATHRVRGHYEGDPQKYRNPRELEELPARDPVARCARRLREAGCPGQRLEALARRVEERVEAAAAEALAAGLPDFEEAADGVYAVAQGA